MQSEWNWLGIIIWILVIAYFLWIIENIHSRKAKLLKIAVSNKKHNRTAEDSLKNFEITTAEVLVFVIAFFGMYMTTTHHHIKPNNSRITAQAKPLQYTKTKRNKKHPFARIHHYYVEVRRSKSRTYTQKYGFMMNGEYVNASNKNAILITSNQQLKDNKNIPYVVQRKLKKEFKKVNQHKEYAIKFTTAYKNNLVNGLGMHAGQKKANFTIIKVPNTKKGIYVNKSKVKPKKNKKSMK